MFNLQLNGLQKLGEYLKTVHEEIGSSCSKVGIVEACKVIDTIYQGQLPSGTQYKVKPRIKDVTAYKVWKFPDGTGYAGVVGTRSGAAPHSHLIEDGTKPRRRIKFGIGGRFKYMMIPRFRNPNPKRIPVKFVMQRKVGHGVKPETLTPGSKPTRTGKMPATHPLAKAMELGRLPAQEAFERGFSDQFVKIMSGK